MKNKLCGVEDTLYIPLVARIYASKRFPDFFYDEKSLELEEHILKIVPVINTTEFFNMASACRQQKIDKKIKEFLNAHKECNVVFLGAGLETAYDRIGNKTAKFYQVDLPNVINVRKGLLGEAVNEKLISGDMFTLEWINEIDTKLPSMVVVSGVYQYFTKPKIVNMIKRMAERISKFELVFDATNTTGLKFANKYVKKTGNIDATMYFSIDDVCVFSQEVEMKLVSLDGFFSDALLHCKGMSLKTKIYMYFADKLRRTMVIHLCSK